MNRGMTAPSPLPAGTRVRVTGPNIWHETDDQGREGHVTRPDVMGDYGVAFDDGCAPFGSYFTPDNLEVLS